VTGLVRTVIDNERVDISEVWRNANDPQTQQTMSCLRSEEAQNVRNELINVARENERPESIDGATEMTSQAS